MSEISIYRCVFKANENYASLDLLEPTASERSIYTIFPDGVDNAPGDLTEYQRQIDKVLESSEPNDYIIFNGPAWLIALVGYRWYADENRRNHNVLVYNKEQERYVLLTYGAIDDY